jgi:hypothetical protein|nr:MAG TPA: adenine-specific methyltransferase [Caudoviricetes sp.]
MSTNKNLHAAKKAKVDEFYTPYEVVENEMEAYLSYNPAVFRDKFVLCPCDDPQWSNFTRYFVRNFKRLGLRRLVSSCYCGGLDSYAFDPVLSSLNYAFDDALRCHGKVLDVDASNIDSLLNLNSYPFVPLQGDGDFRSLEVTAYRDECDFIITNPPFSLYREFIGWCRVKDRKISLISPLTCVTYKNVFRLIKYASLWGGCTNISGVKYKMPDGRGVALSNTCWLTNILHCKRFSFLYSVTRDVSSFVKFDGLDVMEVASCSKIPLNYDGVMGVPINFLLSYNPDQFELLDVVDWSVSGVNRFRRVLIKNKFLTK